jgi:hypothetical protein
MKNDAKFKIRDSKLHNSLVVPDEIYPIVISEISDFVHLCGRVLLFLRFDLIQVRWLGWLVRQKSHEPPNLTISPKSIYLDPPMMTKSREFLFVVFIKAKANFEFSLLNCEFYLPIFAIILVRARLSYLGMPTQPRTSGTYSAKKR